MIAFRPGHLTTTSHELHYEEIRTTDNKSRCQQFMIIDITYRITRNSLAVLKLLKLCGKPSEWLRCGAVYGCTLTLPGNNMKILAYKSLEAVQDACMSALHSHNPM